MFEKFMNFFKKLVKSEEKEVPSKETAKERLHLVLMQDRANVSADFLELMKQEIIEVIKKYIDVEESAIDVRLTNEVGEDGKKGAPSLYANIPILKIKNEMKNANKDNIEKNSEENNIEKEKTKNKEEKEDNEHNSKQKNDKEEKKLEKQDDNNEKKENTKNVKPEERKEKVKEEKNNQLEEHKENQENTETKEVKIEEKKASK